MQSLFNLSIKIHLKKDKICQEHQNIKVLKISGIQMTFNKLSEIKKVKI